MNVLHELSLDQVIEDGAEKGMVQLTHNLLGMRVRSTLDFMRRHTNVGASIASMLENLKSYL